MRSSPLPSSVRPCAATATKACQSAAVSHQDLLVCDLSIDEADHRGRCPEGDIHNVFSNPIAASFRAFQRLSVKLIAACRLDHCGAPMRFATFCCLTVLVLGAGEVVVAQSIRVSTFNVNWGNRHGDQVLAAIAAADPDILCLQETTPQSERFLTHQLTERFPEFHAAGHTGAYAAERLAFASQLPPRDLKFYPPRAGLFGFYAATFTIGDRNIRVLNLHLTPILLTRGSGLRDAMGALMATEEKHRQEIEAVLAAVDPDVPTIIVGDFNSLSSFEAPRRLVAAGFTDSFAAVNDQADTLPTWRWPTRPLPLALRIDYIFHSKHFRTVTSEIIQQGGSDHFPVVSELEFRSPSPSPDPHVK